MTLGFRARQVDLQSLVLPLPRAQRADSRTQSSVNEPANDCFWHLMNEGSVSPPAGTESFLRERAFTGKITDKDARKPGGSMVRGSRLWANKEHRSTREAKMMGRKIGLGATGICER